MRKMGGGMGEASIMVGVVNKENTVHKDKD